MNLRTHRNLPCSPVPRSPGLRPGRPGQPPTSSAPTSSYLLGPNDQISLVVDQLPDDFTDKLFRIDQNGDLSLPVIGRIHATAVLHRRNFEDQVKSRFGIVLKSRISSSTSQRVCASQPVSRARRCQPSRYPAAAGRQDSYLTCSRSRAGCGSRCCGTTVKITRDLKWGAIPLPGATVSSSGLYSVASVRVQAVMQATEENIAIRAGDTIFVPKAEMVYVVGSVTMPGGFPIGESDTLTALQVVALAQGMIKTAAPDESEDSADRARHFQPVRNPHQSQAAAGGKGGRHVSCGRRSIPFRPSSSGLKTTGYRTIEAIVNAATGVAIYGRY